MKTFGVMTYALDASQQGVMIVQSLNKIVKEHVDISPVVFYREFYQLAIVPNFSMMEDVEMWSFPNPIISTSLAATQRLIKSPCPTKKFFYVMNLEWLYMTPLEYSYLDAVYNHPDVQLIARSEAHASLLGECWQKPIAIIEDFNPKQILELVL